MALGPDPVFDELREMLVSMFGVPFDEVAPDSVLESLGLDSLALIEFTLALQRRFGVAIGSDAIEPSHTVDSVTELVAGARS